MIVTIDGPAGSGKSTVARRLAARLGFRFLDTGAMYRAVAWACTRDGVPWDAAEQVAETARRVRFEWRGERLLVDGTDVSEAIRTAEFARGASEVAVNPAVREELVLRQRAFAAEGNVVSEGRDQGTVVFPRAECKFFLTADPEERAMRRQLELSRAGEEVELADLVAQIVDRDHRDASRAVAPLRPADDALVVDTTGIPFDGVVDRLERLVRERRG